MDNYPKDPDALYMRSIGNPSIAKAVEIEKKQDELDAMYADGVQDYSDLRMSSLEAPSGCFTLHIGEDDSSDALEALYGDEVQDDDYAQQAGLRIDRLIEDAQEYNVTRLFVWREK